MLALETTAPVTLEDRKPMASKGSILVIEDEPSIYEGLVYNLELEGYQVRLKTDGKEGLRDLLADPPEVLILDLMLPHLSGIEICRQLRASPSGKRVRVLMLTAKSAEVDQVEGFSVGADDYVTKPYSVKVLLQRVNVLMQRREGAPLADRLEMHGIAIDRVAHQVFLHGGKIDLTPTEFRILEALMAQPGRAFGRADLLTAAVGDDTIVLERTIDVHIRSLRAKLGDSHTLIETVRGIGYRFARELP